MVFLGKKDRNHEFFIKMDFFEKAHKQKNQTTSKNVSNFDQTLKKELKRMLHGYKLNDNNMIKKSSEKVNNPNNIVAIDSYIDLDDYDDDDKSSKQDEQQDSETLVSSPNTSSNTASQNANEKVIAVSSVASSVDMDMSDEPGPSFIETQDSESILSSAESKESGSFDAEGELAAKIHSQINIVKQKKRKNFPKSTQDQSSKGSYQKEKVPKIDSFLFSSESNESDDIEDFNKAFGLKCNKQRSPSPPFISLETKAIQVTSIDQVLGYNDIQDTQRNKTSAVDTKMFSFNYTGGKVKIQEAIVESHIVLPDSGQIEHDNSTGQIEHDNSTMSVNSPPLHEPVEEDMDYGFEPLEVTEVSDHKIEAGIPKFQVLNTTNSCIVYLKHPSEIYISGKVQVEAFCGHVEIYGYTLQDKLHNVYAPIYNHALSLKTVETQHTFNGLFSKLTNAGISVKHAEYIVLEIQESDAVIHLKPLNCSVMDFLENNFRSINFYKKQSKYIEVCFVDSSRLLSCSLTLSRPWKCFEENSNWNQVIQCGLRKQSRGIVCGGKNAGKSTFLRYCVNKLLSQGPVLVIDLDPGQCEFTVPGNLSAVTVTEPLIGPNYTHLTTPDKCLNIGMINVMENMSCYLDGVTQLIDYCLNNHQYDDMPWVINTMGMCNTAGLKLITYAILKAKPTYLLQIDSKHHKTRFECYLNAHTVKKLYREQYRRANWFSSIDFDDDFEYSFFVSHQYTESKNKNSGGLAPRVARDLNISAYFGQLTQIYRTKNILSIIPYRVPLNQFKISSNVRINKDNVYRILNGKIIALCQQTRPDNTNQQFVLQDKPMICHGYGLIRGVDPNQGSVYIVTPTPESVLLEIDTFLYVDWMPDFRGYESQLPNGVKVPYRMESLQEHRNLITAPKRRFNPIQFLKQSRT